MSRSYGYMSGEIHTYEIYKKKQYGRMKDELRFSKYKIDKLETYHITLIKDITDKPLEEYELALQEFFIISFNRTKLASMIYGVSRSNGEGVGHHKKPCNPRIETLIKPSNPFHSSSAKKGLYSQFVPTTDAKVLN